MSEVRIAVVECQVRHAARGSGGRGAGSCYVRSMIRLVGRVLAGTARPLPCLACALVLVALACGDATSVRAPVGDRADGARRPRAVARFVDRGVGVEPESATIGNQTRYVLRAFPPLTLIAEREQDVPRNGRLFLEIPLPGLEVDAERIALRAYVQRTPPERGRGHRPPPRWHPLPPIIGRIEGKGEQAVALALFDGRPVAGRRVRLRVHGTVVPRVVPVEETQPLEVPAAATLALGFGVLEPAWSQGPVRFRVEACRDGDCEALLEESLDPRETDGRRWQDRTLSLASLSGRRVSFRFVARPDSQALGAFSLPVWSNPTVLAPAPASGMNLLLVSLDTLRADHLPTYGYGRDTAPFIDRALARPGVVFDRVITAATTTAPSHMTMFTSLLPSVHGVRSNRAFEPLPGSAQTLAEVLRAQRVATGAVLEVGAMSRPLGFGRGFAEYSEIGAHGPGAPATVGHIEATLARAEGWLDRHAAERFFLFVHSYQVHTPYAPPAAYADLFREPAPGVSLAPGIPSDWHPDRYDREIRYSDDRLAEFFGRLEARGWLDDTLVVFTSDHGEGFLEHGYLGHGPDIHDEVLRVPLVFRGPGVSGGRRVDTPVGLVDLMPTLLELMGAPAPAGMEGRSFAALVRGDAPNAGISPHPIYSEAWGGAGFGRGAAARIVPPTFSVRLGDRKLIRFRGPVGPRYVYYDLASDPGEEHDLYAADPEAVRDLRELLDGYEARTAARAEALQRAAPVVVGPPDEGLLDPEREAQLEALGYFGPVPEAGAGPGSAAALTGEGGSVPPHPTGSPAGSP